MDNFKVIYQILSMLEGSLDLGSVDKALFTADAFGVSENRFFALLKMLQDEGYIQGVAFLPGNGTGAKMTDPRITLKGLEYLEDNGALKRAAKLLKEVKETIPGL